MICTNQEDDDGRAGEGAGVCQPGGQAVERLPAAHVVHEERPRGSTVIAPGDAAEPLLAGRVPDLQLHHPPAHRHDFAPEFHSYRMRAVLLELTFDKLIEQAGLAAASRSNHEELKQKVVLVLRTGHLQICSHQWLIFTSYSYNKVS